MDNPRIAFILGTRPEIIKMSPLIRECESRDLDYFIIHTGQHYSYKLDKIFFQELVLPNPNIELNTPPDSPCKQVGEMVVRLASVLEANRPDIVLVEGDTNTVLAGALAASKMNIKVGHVEAGLRSYDRSMPEETNRVITDHISDILFAPTENSRQNLLKEGIDDKRIHVTGNTIVDAIYQNKKIADKKPTILRSMRLSPKGYFLSTIHRAENTDVKERLQGIITGLQQVRETYQYLIVLPLHPRTKKMIEHFHISTEGIDIIEPLGYLDYLQLESNAALILTDSGGVQEEACILGVPCVTLRDNTERPETISVGSNILVGTCPGKIIEGAGKIVNKENTWQQPFGNIGSGKRIIQAVIDSG